MRYPFSNNTHRSWSFGIRTLCLLVLLGASAGTSASVLTISGTGGTVTDGDDAGTYFTIVVTDPRMIPLEGDNVTLKLLNVSTTGGLTDYFVKVYHVDPSGVETESTVMRNVTRTSEPYYLWCYSPLNGDYTFNSGASTTLQSQCSTVFPLTSIIPPGTYVPTTQNDTRVSKLSRKFNGQPVAGTWRLWVADTNEPGGDSTMNSDWTWQLDIVVEGDDPDSDGDGIDDSIDNCPLIANADQADFDGDNIGDTCDEDVDNDGFVYELDSCPFTALGTVVNQEGCNAAQFVARSCVAENFKNHGQYVSCVTHAANEAVDQGLIYAHEKSAFIKQATQSK